MGTSSLNDTLDETAVLIHAHLINVQDNIGTLRSVYRLVIATSGSYIPFELAKPQRLATHSGLDFPLFDFFHFSGHRLDKKI